MRLYGDEGERKEKKDFWKKGKKQSTMGGMGKTMVGGVGKKKEIELSFQKLLAYCYCCGWKEGK